MSYVQPAVPQILPPVIPFSPPVTVTPWNHILKVTNIKRLRNNAVEITVFSNKSSDGYIFYYWYLNGDHIQTTQKPSFTFYLLDNENIQIDVIDHTSPDMDVDAEAPDGYPSRHLVYWNPPESDSDVSYYRVRSRKDAGSWVVIGEIDKEIGKWNYFLITPPLDDLGSYEIDVAAVDLAGNIGTTVASEAFNVLTVPDGDNYVAVYSEITNKFTTAGA